MFNAYMTDTVTLVKRDGTVSWGEKSEIETEVKARVDWKFRMVRDFKGEQVVSSAIVYLKSTFLKVQDRIKIDGTEYPILSVKKVKSFSKILHLEVYVG